MDKEERRGRYSKRVKSSQRRKGKRSYSPWYGLIGRLERRILAKGPAHDFNHRQILDFRADQPPKDKKTIKSRRTGCL